MIIRGEKVDLRPVEKEDLSARLEWSNDPETRYFGGDEFPMNSKAIEEEFGRENSANGYVNFAILDDGGKLIGDLAFSVKSGCADFGIKIGYKDYWGRVMGRRR